MWNTIYRQFSGTEKYYLSELTIVLASFEKASDWPDLVKALQKLNKLLAKIGTYGDVVQAAKWGPGRTPRSRSSASSGRSTPRSASQRSASQIRSRSTRTESVPARNGDVGSPQSESEQKVQRKVSSPGLERQKSESQKAEIPNPKRQSGEEKARRISQVYQSLLPLITKRLAQCLNPDLPGGVHLKSLETYDTLLSLIEPQSLIRDLPLFTMGLFPVLSYASIRVTPKLLDLYENYFLPLGPDLTPSVSGFVKALLPALQETHSDLFTRVFTIMDHIRFVCDREVFVLSLWSCSLHCPEVRLSVMNYISKTLENGEDGTVQGLIPESSLICVQAFSAAVQDDNILVQRGFLDVIISNFRLNEIKFNDENTIKLIEGLLPALLQREPSVNRRIFQWIHSGISEDSQPKVSDQIKEALLSIMKRCESSAANCITPFDILSALLEQHASLARSQLYAEMHAPLLTYAHRCARSLPNEGVQSLLVSARNFFKKVPADRSWAVLSDSIERDFLLAGGDLTCRSADTQARQEKALDFLQFLVLSIPMKLKEEDGPGKSVFPSLLGNILSATRSLPFSHVVLCALESCQKLFAVLPGGTAVLPINSVRGYIRHCEVPIKDLDAGADMQLFLGIAKLKIKTFIDLLRVVLTSEKIFNSDLDLRCSVTQFLDMLAGFPLHDVPDLACAGARAFVDILKEYPFLPRSGCPQVASGLWCLLDTEYCHMHQTVATLMYELQSLSQESCDRVIAEDILHPGRRDDVADSADAFHRFAALWRHIGGQKPNELVFSKGLMLMLDSLEDTRPLVKSITRIWIREALSNMNRVLDPLFVELFHRSTTTDSLTYVYNNLFDARRVEYALRKLISIILSDTKTFMGYLLSSTPSPRTVDLFLSMYQSDILKKDAAAYTDDYPMMLSFLGLHFIQGRAPPDAPVEFRRSIDKVRSLAIDFIRELLSIIPPAAETGGRSRGYRVAVLLSEPVLVELSKALDEREYMMQVQLIGLMKEIVFESYRDLKVPINPLYQSSAFSVTLLGGIQQAHIYLERHKLANETLGLLRTLNELKAEASGVPSISVMGRPESSVAMARESSGATGRNSIKSAKSGRKDSTISSKSEGGGVPPKSAKQEAATAPATDTRKASGSVQESTASAVETKDINGGITQSASKKTSKRAQKRARARSRAASADAIKTDAVREIETAAASVDEKEVERAASADETSVEAAPSEPSSVAGQQPRRDSSTSLSFPSAPTLSHDELGTIFDMISKSRKRASTIGSGAHGRGQHANSSALSHWVWLTVNILPILRSATPSVLFSVLNVLCGELVLCNNSNDTLILLEGLRCLYVHFVARSGAALERSSSNKREDDDSEIGDGGFSLFATIFFLKPKAKPKDVQQLQADLVVQSRDSALSLFPVVMQALVSAWQLGEADKGTFVKRLVLPRPVTPSLTRQQSSTSLRALGVMIIGHRKQIHGRIRLFMETMFEAYSDVVMSSFLRAWDKLSPESTLGSPIVTEVPLLTESQSTVIEIIRAMKSVTPEQVVRSFTNVVTFWFFTKSKEKSPVMSYHSSAFHFLFAYFRSCPDSDAKSLCEVWPHLSSMLKAVLQPHSRPFVLLWMLNIFKVFASKCSEILRENRVDRELHELGLQLVQQVALIFGKPSRFTSNEELDLVPPHSDFSDWNEPFYTPEWASSSDSAETDDNMSQMIFSSSSESLSTLYALRCLAQDLTTVLRDTWPVADKANSVLLGILPYLFSVLGDMSTCSPQTYACTCILSRLCFDDSSHSVKLWKRDAWDCFLRTDFFQMDGAN
eukprot:850917_1